MPELICFAIESAERQVYGELSLIAPADTEVVPVPRAAWVSCSMDIMAIRV